MQMMLWSGTVVKEGEEREVEEYLRDKLGGTRQPVRFVGCVVTLPGQGGEGGRHDAMFLIHRSDVQGVAVARLKAMFEGGPRFGQLRWWEDVFYNQQEGIYADDFKRAYPPIW